MGIKRNITFEDLTKEQLCKMAKDLATDNFDLRWDLEKLKDFARRDVQEWAEELGLIVPHIATEEDVDDESDHEIGDKIYKFSELLQEKP